MTGPPHNGIALDPATAGALHKLRQQELAAQQTRMLRLNLAAQLYGPLLAAEYAASLAAAGEAGKMDLNCSRPLQVAEHAANVLLVQHGFMQGPPAPGDAGGADTAPSAAGGG